MRLLPSLLVLLAAGATTLHAEDSTSIRLKVGMVPGADTLKLETSVVGSDSTVPGEIALEAKSGTGVTVALNKLSTGTSGFGYALEGGLFYRSHSGEVGSAEGEVTAFGTEFGLDAAYVVPQVTGLVLTAGPRVGLGLGQQSESDSLLNDGTGFYLSYGLQTEATYTVAKNFQFGATLGWMGFTSTATRDFADDFDVTGNADITYSGSGVVYGLVAGYEF